MIIKQEKQAATIQGVELVKDVKSKTVFKVEKRLSNEEKSSPEEVEVLEYSNLVKRLEKGTLPLETSGRYILIKFPEYSVPGFVSEIFYEIQLLGYIPIIANAEQNIEFNRNPKKLYTLVAKGALVQIDETSLNGEKGKTIRKFAVKLCRHRLVHVVSSKVGLFTGEHGLSESAHVYLRKKVPPGYLDYLQSNAKHIREGLYFHPEPPIRMR